MTTDAGAAITGGRTALGIELGSTRIKAVLIGPDHAPLAVGSHDWENQFVDRMWTYSLEAVWNGLQDCYAALAADVRQRYGVELTTVGALGVSAMMHGYLAFDADGERSGIRTDQHRLDPGRPEFDPQGGPTVGDRSAGMHRHLSRAFRRPRV